MIIDDSVFTLHHYGALVEDLGHEVITSNSGSEGIQTFRDAKPDIVFCDLMMPHMDGFDVLKEIGASLGKTVFLFLTADIQDSTHEKALRLGAKDLITKPLTEESLQEVLKRYGF